MKKLALVLTAVAILTNSTAMAEKTSGRAAVASTQTASDSKFAWGIGLAGLVIVGTVIGIVAASASQTHSFSH